MADSTRACTSSRLQPILQRQRVHDGGQHAHVVGGGAIHAHGGTGEATEDIAAADHDTDLGTGFDGFLDVAA